ncbi:MAG TPA: isoprenylcysteine carboxylmethyltransferase family protein [Tepidisphaeraceae bacterium]|jgi:protein-S-isoprenylcysteine O-methyltransferase Ste14|nr:isoprenylcysteine carboxylmethyltransferase family protein [Tepidisphaeraceae bacterium]
MWNPEGKLPAISAPVLSLLAMLFAIGYVALAAWGFGAWRALLAEPARAGVCGALVLLAGATPLCGCNLSAGEKSHGGNDWIFPFLLIAGLLMGFGSAWCDRRNFLTLGGNVVRYAGLSLFLIGCVLRVASMLILGPRFSVWVAIQSDHRLQTTGLYRFVRHPSYTGAIFTLFGWAITFRSDIGILLAALMVLPLVRRMIAEEKLLIAVFGDEYTSYRERTWRLIPLVY